jgi:SAM-dependent methyltransferase
MAVSQKLKRQIKKTKRILRLKPFYQEQRSSAFEERWQMLAAHMDAADRSLLDIGCNIGQFTARAAARGMFAIGIDVFEEVVARAVKVNRDQQGAVFGRLELSPDKVGSLPRTDVTLCMSVHHYWSREHGEPASWRMIGEILDKTRKLFFEPASSHVRYGAHIPDFINNDAASIDAYVLRNFAAVSGGRARVVKLGSTVSIRQETHRHLYLVT